MDLVTRNIKVPTGNICIMTGDKGDLEFLSIGDYGKSQNIKAQFLNVNSDINGVPNGNIMPLQEKWVITLSTQYGCSMECKFCDVHKVGKGVNATYKDMENQIREALMLHPEVGSTKRLNIHYARMGEPTWNRSVLDITYNLRKIIKPYIGRSLTHPVYTTMMPKNNKFLIEYLQEWTNDIKNDYFRGDAGLQLSINSTDDSQRNNMFSNNALPLNEISEIGKSLPIPKGRKYSLNFALADEYIIDAKKLRTLFNPDKFMVKITPLHQTLSCDENNIKTSNGYTHFTPYKEKEKALIGEGFDVLIFVPSYDEDLGRITCGNAILSGSKPKCKYTETNNK